LKIGVKQKKDVKVSLTDEGNDSDSIKSAECDEKRSYTPEPTAHHLSHLQKTEESKAFSQSLIG
jgi:hypothetical protein